MFLRSSKRSVLLAMLTCVGGLTVVSLPAQADSRAETTGGVTHTWTNYANAGGSEGPTTAGQVTVSVSCRLVGFNFADGNTWWYRISSAPWSDQYYASADAFYNNGSTSGSLRGTPFVDLSVPECASLTSGGGSTGGAPGSGSTNPSPVTRTSNYDGQKAANWAYSHYSSYAHAVYSGEPCTLFVSNALWQGGMSQTTTWANTSKYYWDSSKRGSVNWGKYPTRAATLTPEFEKYLVSTTKWATLTEIPNLADSTANGAQIGDIILYRWPDGYKYHVANFDHASIVTSVRSDGTRVVSQQGDKINKAWNVLTGNGKSYATDSTLKKSKAWVLRVTH
jgi:hypothetical protein